MQYEPSSQQYVPAQPYAPAQQFPPHRAGWSALAITAFVCSLLGFLGFTAILGIILGIAGIVVSRGGRKRGMGLAIAAIPISVVTGLLSLAIVFGVVMAMRFQEVHSSLMPALKAADPASADAVAGIRRIADDSFNQEVTDEQLGDWLRKVRETNGSLVSLEPDRTAPATPGADGTTTINFTGKFVNGQAGVHLRLRPEGMFSMHFHDIDVCGVSPRDAK